MAKRASGHTSPKKPVAKRVGLGALPVAPGTPPMEAKLVEALPAEAGWQFEPKWDGFRCLAYRAGPDIELQSKSGKSLARYFPEMVAALRSLSVDRFVLDGELVISVDGALSFDALQARLHPAESRIRKLSAETPALFILFDCLAMDRGPSLLEMPLIRRRGMLEKFIAAIGDQPSLRLTPFTRDAAQARRWLDRAHGSLDGIVAKRLDGPYVPGERAMLKVKLLRSADCVVGGFRYESDSKLVGSLLLGLYDGEGKLHHVGFTSAIRDAERAALTDRLKKLIAPPGFTGGAPGGPSRWSTERSAEWQPLHGTRLLRWRPDKKPAQCTCDQLQREVSPAKLVTDVISR